VNHAQSRSAATRRSAASPDNRGVYRLALDQTAIRRLVAAGGRSSSVISLRSASSWPGSRGGFWEFKQDPLRSQTNRRAVFAAECRARSIPVAPRSRLYCGLAWLHDVLNQRMALARHTQLLLAMRPPPARFSREFPVSLNQFPFRPRKIPGFLPADFLQVIE
jgi:hypothetical protein